MKSKRKRKGYGKIVKRGIAMAMAVLMAVSGGLVQEEGGVVKASGTYMISPIIDAIILSEGEIRAAVVTGAATISASAVKKAYTDSNGIQYELYDNETCAVIGVEDTTIEEVVLPNSIKSDGITYLVISIGTPEFVPYYAFGTKRCAFGGCSRLTSIEIPESVTNIGSKAFSECSSLKNIKIPESVTSIGVNAFSDCDVNVIIYGDKDSVAEKYANENNLKFIVTIEEEKTPTATPKENTKPTMVPNTKEPTSVPTETSIPKPTQEAENNSISSIEPIITSKPTQEPESNSISSIEPTITPELISGEKNNNISSAEPTPTTQPTSAPIQSVEPTPTPEPTGTPTITIPEENTILTVSKNNCKVKVLSNTEENPTVAYTKSIKIDTTNITIPATVKVNGITYKVTNVSAKAFSGNKKITKVTIGKNVTTISKNAFKKCTNLKKITVKSKVLTSVESNALKGTSNKLVIKVPKEKVSVYKKLFQGKGNTKAVVK